MELRALKYFVAVAREGNISLAAAKQHVSQPALSRQIKELERELGQALFERQSHGVVLTVEGQALLEYAEQMIEIEERVKRSFETMKSQPLGDVYIGGAESDSLREIAHAAAAARRLQPSMAIHYSAGNENDVLSRLDRGMLDFVILAQPEKLDKYNSLALPRQDRWAVHMLPDNPLAKKKSIRREDLVNEPLIMSEQVMGAKAENNVSEWFGDMLPHLIVPATFNLHYTGMLFVEEGLGSMLTYDYGHLNDHDRLVARPLDPPIVSQMVLVWRQGERLSRAASFFLEVLEQGIDSFADGENDALGQ